MELIKRIKQAETQAQEIIEQAKAEGAKQAEKARQHRRQALEEAEQERKKSIEASVAAAQSQGLAEVDHLRVQAEQRRQQLRDKVGGKIPEAVAKVMDYLKG